MYKTLNNHVAKFIIENSVSGNPKFTFIRLYNAMKDKEFDFDLLPRLFEIVKKIINECHEVDDIIFAIDDCPLAVRYWLHNYKNELLERRCYL